MSAVRYFVNDVEEAIDFYTNILDFQLVEQYGPAMAILRRENLNLWLAGPFSSAAQPLEDGDAPAPGGWNRIVLFSNNLHTELQKVQQGGYKVRVPLREGPVGNQLVLEDPSGNCVELFEEARAVTTE